MQHQQHKAHTAPTHNKTVRYEITKPKKKHQTDTKTPHLVENPMLGTRAATAALTSGTAGPEKICKHNNNTGAKKGKKQAKQIDRQIDR